MIASTTETLPPRRIMLLILRATSSGDSIGPPGQPSSSDRAGAVHTGAVAVVAEVAAAAIDVACAPSTQRRQAGATGAVAEAALSIRGTGRSAVPAATAVPIRADLTAAARSRGAACPAPAGSARTSSDE